MTKPRTFEESYQAIRAAGGDAWDNLDVEQELAAMRGQPQGIEALVCDDITERQALGINKYGKTVAENPLCLFEWLEHAYQECLDQAVYIRRAMAEIDKIMVAKASDEAEPNVIAAKVRFDCEPPHMPIDDEESKPTTCSHCKMVADLFECDLAFGWYCMKCIDWFGAKPKASDEATDTREAE